MKNKFNCILLIDDDVATNELHKIIIDGTGVAEKVQSVTSGQEALDYLTNSRKYEKNNAPFPQPDLIFLDINMPAMNGFEFIEEYEKLEINQKGRIVVIMLTSSLNPDDQYAAEKIENINGFNNKPLTEQMLFDLTKKYQTE